MLESVGVRSRQSPDRPEFLSPVFLSGPALARAHATPAQRVSKPGAKANAIAQLGIAGV